MGNPYQCIYRKRWFKTFFFLLHFCLFNNYFYLIFNVSCGCSKESQVTEINYGLQKLVPCFEANNKATVSVQCPKSSKARVQKQNSVGESTIYQQLILNRNIQVFLQLEQFSKQKPIILSRKQYDKVKKTIQRTISTKKSSHIRRNTLLSKLDSSEISIGEVRTKKVKCSASPSEKATDQTPKSNHQCNQIACQTDFCCGACKNILNKPEVKSRCCKLPEDIVKKVEGVCKQGSKGKEDKSKAKTLVCSECDDVAVKKSEVETFVLYNADTNRDNFDDTKETEHATHARKTMSSVQIRYAGVSYMKQAAYSSTDVGAISDSSIGHLNSFQTLFRGG